MKKKNLFTSNHIKFSNVQKMKENTKHYKSEVTGKEHRKTFLSVIESVRLDIYCSEYSKFNWNIKRIIQVYGWLLRLYFW